MKTSNHQPGDDRLHALLHESRPAPQLPPRFQENVWRRIEQCDAHSGFFAWMEALSSLFLKPRFAIATVAALLLAGALLGSLDGQARARGLAQDRYVARVAMPFNP